MTASAGSRSHINSRFLSPSLSPSQHEVWKTHKGPSSIHLSGSLADHPAQDTLYSEWADQYIDYGGLKKQIKANLPWNDTAEADFVQALQNQLTKCETFQRNKSDELMNHIQQLEEEVKGLVEKAGYSDGGTSDEDDRADNEATTPGDVERNVRDRRDDDAGSDDDDDDDEDVSSDMLIDAIEERFRELEEQVAVLVADVHDLALFTKLNFTGFIKIVKKHDVRDALLFL